MSSPLRCRNEELLVQLKAGQAAVQASFNRLHTKQSCQNSETAVESVKCLQEQRNLEIKGGLQKARSKLAAKMDSGHQSSTPEAKGVSFVNLSPKSLRLANEKENNDNSCTNDLTDPTIDDSLSTTLLEDVGNLRRPKHIVENVDLDDSQGVRSILHRSVVQRRTTPTRVQFNVGDTERSQSTGEKCTKNSSMLGYDWIAGMLENCGKMEALENTGEFFEELRQFRRQNKEECVAREFRHESLIEDVLHDLRPGQRPDIQPYSGQLTVDQIMDAKDNEEPIYSYTVNERLFPIPVNADTENRVPGTPDAPQILKVSIPSYRLQPRPSRLQPHRRRSIDESDSFSLISHCQVGFHPGPLTKTKSATPADLPSNADEENARKRRPPRSEKEAVASIRRSIDKPRKPPLDLTPRPSPRVVDAMLTRKEMNLDPSVTARCEAVRKAGARHSMRFM